MSEHPTIDEFDVGSWLDGSLTEHDVIRQIPGGAYQLDGAPSFRTEGLSHGEGSFLTRCEQHSYEHAATFGYVGPISVLTAYQPGHRFERELGMLLRDDAGAVVSVATYSYGRASFEPGEPRTNPCGVCGVETLVSALREAATR